MHTATLSIDLSALAENYRFLKNTLNGRLCAAVVKANAYGLGVEAVSQKLWQEGCRDFFVATLDEGIELRGILPEGRIYVFNGLLSGQEKEYATHKLIPILNTVEQVARAENLGMQCALHIDTGMTRLGLNETETLALTSDSARITRANIKMVMSHLACASDPNNPKNTEQLARFEKAFHAFPPGIAASLANSSGILLSPDYHYDLARPGCALYGIAPTSENPMKHVATLSAPLLQVRECDRDETVGYNGTYAAKKGSRIAIVALGYADGYLRHLSNNAFAYLGGHKVPVAGRVSMDMIALDVSGIPESALGNRAEFINAQQTVDDIAKAAGTIGYEIFTRIGRRVKRIYS